MHVPDGTPSAMVDRCHLAPVLAAAKDISTPTTLPDVLVPPPSRLATASAPWYSEHLQATIGSAASLASDPQDLCRFAPAPSSPALHQPLAAPAGSAPHS
mmetsp:Transcript_8559/g.14701  ORF Transcript_8559/g.14701 Transcript_8559/m.14701 type:complete len:100 (+) Transcript_8559:11-310(+)